MEAKQLKKSFFIALISLTFLLFSLFQYQDAFTAIEDQVYSAKQLLRNNIRAPQSQVSLDDPVLIVYTDEAFYAEYNAFPLRRTDLATIVQRLSDLGARVIGIDMLLDFNSAYGEDPILEQTFANSDNLVLVSQAVFRDGQFVELNKPIPRFDQYSNNGYSNIASNSALSEIITRLRIHKSLASMDIWPFAIEVVARYLGARPQLDHRGQLIFDDKLSVGLDRLSDLFIDYPLLNVDRAGQMLNLHQQIGLSAAELLYADKEDLEELAFLVADKIILIGEVAEVGQDTYRGLLDDVYGVEIIADEILTMLDGAPIQAAPTAIGLLQMLLLWAVFIAMLWVTRAIVCNLLMIALTTALFAGNLFVYVSLGWLIPLTYAALASLIALIAVNSLHYFSEVSKKKQIQKSFGQYLSPEVVAELVDDPSKVRLGGEEREMTALFSDIAKFSTISESMAPNALVEMLNDYLTRMCNVILDLNGTIDKFEGDAIIAFWGAPSVQANHATLACLASIDMNAHLALYNQSRVQKGLAPLYTRIGLNSGLMTVGSIGSAQRMDYTMIGDSVNLAARLEGVNKVFGTQILISGSTYAAAKDAIDVRKIGAVRVVGKSVPVEIYEPTARKNSTSGAMNDVASLFSAAVELYQQANLDDALSQFKRCAKLLPDDQPTQFYIAQIAALKKTGMSPDWSGIFELTEK